MVRGRRVGFDRPSDLLGADRVLVATWTSTSLATVHLQPQGVPVRVVMDTLGHSNISITTDTYTHVLRDLQQLAAHPMHRALVRGIER